MDSALQSSARRDLLAVFLGVVLFWGLSVALELHEQVSSLTRPWERYELDELPGVLLFLSAALAWYSWRRAREVGVQLKHRMAAEARLAASLAENRRLSLSHVRVQEDERRELARELHDELGQQLNAIKIDAVSIRNWSDGEQGAARQREIHDAARAIVQATDQVQNVVRDMLHRLRPVALDELGLSAALEHFIERWRARHPATQVMLAINADIDGLDEAQNITLYRAVQEGLTNVVKHAHAAQVRVSVDRKGERIVLGITDDGVGAPAPAPVSGLGLVGMRERVEALGGTLTIVSAAGQGFRIEAALPARTHA